MSLNSESLNAKFPQLQILISIWAEKGIFFDIICLQETWIKAGADTSSFQLNGYNIINQFCCCSDHGGLLIYVLSDFRIKILKQITQSNTWEGLFVEVKKANIDKTFIIGNIYKPPRDNNSRQNTETFINELEPILYELNNTHKEVILAGDYNLNLLKTSDIPHYSEFFDSMLNNSFFPKISFPTRLGRHSCSLIDNFYCKISPNMLQAEAGIMFTRVSDHLPYFMRLVREYKRKPNHSEKVKTRINTQQAKENLLSDLHRANITDKMDSNLRADPNINYEVLEKTVLDLKNRHMPYRFVKFNGYRHKKSKWITHRLIKSIKFRDGLYQKLQRTIKYSLEYTSLKQRLSDFNLILRKSIREAEISYYNATFQKYKNDIKTHGKLFPMYYVNRTNAVHRLTKSLWQAEP